MSVTLELSGHRKLRGGVNGYIKVLVDGAMVFQDGVNLSSAKSRSAFIQDLLPRLMGQVQDGVDLERQLIGLLEQAELALAADPAPEAPSAADEEVRIEEYAQRFGRYEAIKVKEISGESVEVRTVLSNFTAAIDHEVTLDDGIEQRLYLELSGQLRGQPLPRIRLPAEEFGAMNWVLPRYGVGARVLPGNGRKDLLRDAIQAFSENAEKVTIYSHTGWRHTPSGLVYLHGNGAISAQGAVEGVQVELDGNLSGYRLPTPPTDDELRAAVRASWDVWKVASLEAAAPLLGAVYGAPLAEWLHPAFSLWIQGTTGRLKTTFAALMLGHYGDFNWQHVPANFESTANALEKQAFLIKDAPFLIDDYRPPVDRREADEMRRKVVRVLRAAGNHSGRGRMRNDMALRPEYYPRGIVIVTAEERAPGESIAARKWKIEFQETTVDVDRLTEAQGQVSLYGAAAAGYLQWLAGKLDADTDWLQAVYRQSLEIGKGLGGHLRHPQAFAYLLAGWCVFGEFALSVGAVTEDELKDRLQSVQSALRAVGARQEDEARAARPELIFVETLSDLLATGAVYLATVDGDAPPDAVAWGWASAGGNDEEPEHFHHRGTKIGWVDESCVYLIPSIAHKEVARTVEARGETFSVSDQALREMLRRGGLLLPGNKDGGKRHNAWVEGKTQNVMLLDRHALERVWEGERP